jgi:hypothetical protein
MAKMKSHRATMAILATLFGIGAAIGCWIELRPRIADSVSIFAFPGIFLSVMLGIGPHGSLRLFLWASPLCNGIAYAAPVAFALWLRSKLSD